LGVKRALRRRGLFLLQRPKAFILFVYSLIPIS